MRTNHVLEDFFFLLRVAAISTGSWACRLRGVALRVRLPSEHPEPACAARCCLTAGDPGVAAGVVVIRYPAPSFRPPTSTPGSISDRATASFGSRSRAARRLARSNVPAGAIVAGDGCAAVIGSKKVWCPRASAWASRIHSAALRCIDQQLDDVEYGRYQSRSLSGMFPRFSSPDDHS